MMLVEDKYFIQDKNYLLKTVQAFSKEVLLTEWLEEILQAYSNQHNPMGLEDDFIIELRKQIAHSRELLFDHYDILAAIYRFYHSDNQLEIQWDGRSHMEHYDEEWKTKYQKWIEILSQSKNIQRPIIKYATQRKGFNHTFLKTSIRRAILSHFGLRLRSQKLYRVSA